MANTERPISFLKDDFKNPSSGVNPASLKDSEFHVRAESFLPERRAGFRLQQKTTATAGTPSCGGCCWHIQEQVLYPVSVGWVGLSDYAWEVCSSSWKSRPFLGAAYCDGAACVCLTRRHPTACGRLLLVRMGRLRSLHSLPHRQWYWRQIRES